MEGGDKIELSPHQINSKGKKSTNTEHGTSSMAMINNHPVVNPQILWNLSEGENSNKNKSTISLKLELNIRPSSPSPSPILPSAIDAIVDTETDQTEAEMETTEPLNLNVTMNFNDTLNQTMYGTASQSMMMDYLALEDQGGENLDFENKQSTDCLDGAVFSSMDSGDREVRDVFENDKNNKSNCMAEAEMAKDTELFENKENSILDRTAATRSPCSMKEEDRELERICGDNKTSFKMTEHHESNINEVFSANKKNLDPGNDRNNSVDWIGSPSSQYFTVDYSKTKDVEENNNSSWKTERQPCNYGKNSRHVCHVCIPLPEEAIVLLEDTIGLTSTEARKAAFTLLQYLKENQHTNQVNTLMKYIFGSGVSKNKRSQQRQLSPPKTLTSNTKEQKLMAAIRTVARQKGAWGIFEDEEVVTSHLNELNQYLTTLDRTSILKVLREDRYQSVKALCTYFALEKRWTVRSELLDTLELLAVTDSTSQAVLVSSDLPVDLADAIRHEYLENDGGQKRIMAYGMALLSLLVHNLEVDHLDRIDVNFIYCLLQISEGQMKDGCSADLRAMAVNVMLAYNLQFGGGPANVYSNKVIAALSAFKDADYLKQRMFFYLLNKGVSQFHNQQHSFPSPFCHMVVKLVTDILSCHKTRDFFIDADLNIILAGLSSIIAEFEPGDEKRTLTLQLSRLILRCLDYQHNGIRLVLKRLTGILKEKEPVSHRDQKIARKIAREIENSKTISHLTNF